MVAAFARRRTRLGLGKGAPAVGNKDSRPEWHLNFCNCFVVHGL